MVYPAKNMYAHPAVKALYGIYAKYFFLEICSNFFFGVPKNLRILSWSSFLSRIVDENEQLIEYHMYHTDYPLPPFGKKKQLLERGGA